MGGIRVVEKQGFGAAFKGLVSAVVTSILRPTLLAVFNRFSRRERASGISCA
jgi:hypothetical protein